MSGWQRDQHLLLEQRLDGEIDEVLDGRADECRIDLLIVQALHELAAAAFLQHQGDKRRHLAETRATLARNEWMKGRRAGESDHDLALLAARRALGARAGAVHVLEEQCGHARGM